MSEAWIFGDFLKCNLAKDFPSPLAIIGNFPYNISSQILVKILRFKKFPKQKLR